MKLSLITLILVFTTAFSFAQVNTLQLKLGERNFFNNPLKDKNVKVIINDTLVRQLITDEKGITGFIEVPDGEYSLRVMVDKYKDYYIKKVKVSKANSRHLKLKLDKI